LICSNFHTHTTFCDGLNTIQENIEAAIGLGFRSLGFSGHGYVPYAGLYAGMPPEAIREYRRIIDEIKPVYAGRINIFTGLENDSVYMQPADGYDYTIGSVHCVKSGDRYYSVDSKASVVADAVSTAFGGDGGAFAKAYYDAVLDFASIKRADILGHLDLVRRFNTGDSKRWLFFDEGSGAYRRAALDALEMAVRSDYIIEVNTGPLSKGFSDEAYPAVFILERAVELGARIIVGSDAHSVSTLNYAFDKTESVLRGLGFKERWELTPDGFEPVSI